MFFLLASPWMTLWPLWGTGLESIYAGEDGQKGGQEGPSLPPMKITPVSRVRWHQPRTRHYTQDPLSLTKTRSVREGKWLAQGHGHVDGQGAGPTPTQRPCYQAQAGLCDLRSPHNCLAHLTAMLGSHPQAGQLGFLISTSPPPWEPSTIPHSRPRVGPPQARLRVLPPSLAQSLCTS